MKKTEAEKILKLSPEDLVRYWKVTKNEIYLKLSKTRSDEEIVKTIKRMAEDVIAERATAFNMVDGSTKLEYLGE